MICNDLQRRAIPMRCRITHVSWANVRSTSTCIRDHSKGACARSDSCSTPSYEALSVRSAQLARRHSEGRRRVASLWQRLSQQWALLRGSLRLLREGVHTFAQRVWDCVP